MTYDVHLADTFQKSIKALKKKYPHVKDDLLSQIKTLDKESSAGDPLYQAGTKRYGGESCQL
jgi:mRNA-degrading endonuclease RelE of RelBE toxin-antitoxin system